MESLTEFVEMMGDFFSESGKGRICGRLVGFLLICDPPLQSAKQLAEGTGASKGSISTLLRQLVSAGLVERQGLPGKRQTFYQILPGAWWRILSTQIQQITRLRSLADEALEFLSDQPPSTRTRLREMRDFYSFVQERLPTLLMEWQAIRAAEADNSKD